MRYQSEVKLIKKSLLKVMLIGCLFLSACKNYEAAASSYAKAYWGLEVFLAEGEVIQVEYEEVWYFEPYSKKYYIEAENWGKYGLEQDAELAEKTALNYLKLKEDEHVVYIQTYDYQVCDYVEEVVYTIADNDEVRMHCILLDREERFIGSIMLEEFGNTKVRNVEWLKEYVLSDLDDSAFLIEPITYVPLMRVHDINEDGYIDIYYDTNTYYLYEDNGFRLCTEEEKNELLDIYGRTKGEAENVAKLERFQSSYTVLEQTDDERLTYLQFYDISNADKINEQIMQVIEDKDNRTNQELNIYAEEVIYVGEEYLVIHMFTQIPGEYTMTGGSQCNDSRYLTFDLNTGELITFEDVLGEDYTREDVTNLMWIAYEKKMQEIPDQYSKKEFDLHYKFVYEWYDKQKEANGGSEPIMEEYAKCYFTDEGMVVTHCRNMMYGFSNLPIHYYLDERLEMMDGDNNTLEIFCSWEEIYEDA